MASAGGEWKSYRERVMPPQVPDVQLVETRRAFYAGASAVLALCHDTIGDPNASEEEGVAILSGMHEECKQFAQRVEQGEA